MVNRNMAPNLKKIRWGLIKLISLSQKKSGLCILLALSIFAFAAYKANSLSQAVTIIDQLDPDMITTQQLLYTNELFGNSSSLGFVAFPKGEYFTSQELCLLQTSINNIAYNHPSIQSFMTPYKARQAQSYDGKISYLRLVSNPCDNQEFSENPLLSLKNSPWQDILTDKKNRDFAVYFQIKELDTHGPFKTFDPSTIESILKEFQESISLSYFITGTSAQQLFTMKGMAQSQYLNVIVLLILFVGFRLLFGRFKAGFIYIAAVIFSVTCITGLMSLLNYDMDPLSSSLFVMIAISSIEDFVFLSYDRMLFKRSLTQSIRSVILPCFLTSVTTAIGFASLAVSDLQSIRRFGSMAGIGALIEWAVIFILLPALIKKFPLLDGWIDQDKAFFVNTSSKLLSKTPPRILTYASMSVFIIAIFASDNFKLSQTPSEIFPKEHPYQQGVTYLNNSRSWIADASLVFEPNSSKTKKDEILKQLKTHPLVAKTQSYDDIVSFISKKIEDPIDHKSVQFELDHSDIGKRFKADSGHERVSLFLRSTNTELLNDFRLHINSLCGDTCWVTGEFIGFAEYSTVLIKTLFESLLTSLISIAIIIGWLAVSMRQKHIWELVISSLWGPAWMLVLIYTFDISVNFITCIVASTIVGLAGDNAVQFICGDSELEKGVKDKGIGAIQCAVIMALCCLALAGSYFEPPRMLGLLLSSGLVLAMVGDLWILKGLVQKK